MTATDLLLRPATASDAPAVASVHLTARAAAPMPAPVHTDAEVAEFLAGRIGGGDGDEVWVAEEAGQVVGYARFTRTWLDDLYVAPTHARRGVGAALLDVVKARHPDGFGLWVFESNIPARSFYAAHGLVEVRRTDGSANEEGEPDVELSWSGTGRVARSVGALA